jgi:ergothioneine biosynthesis protein EgtB
VPEQARPALSAEPLIALYTHTRTATLELCEGLAPEDTVVQSMPDASPTKWHLAHTTWFWETFLLTPYLPEYRPFHPQFGYLFNSYYYTVGTMFRRPQRGLLSRPTLAEVRGYRAHVDAAMLHLLEYADDDDEIAFLVTLGVNHEQQHQELILTDIKHLLASNPLLPALRATPSPPSSRETELDFIAMPDGIAEIGYDGDGFCFDNETPRHRVLLQSHALASRAVTNGEYLEFIRAGGYTEPSLWLSDGWAKVNAEGWQRPLYWSEDLSSHYTLGGPREVDLAAPVCHVSYYEADAFARWADARLPTEAELEHAASGLPIAGNFVESGFLQPIAGGGAGLTQIYGDVWEWTSSAYSPYPGFKPLRGSLGEYNGKFMCSQLVLRGGSCTTPASHMRSTYRNFFYPDARWQSSGIRLARDQ